MGNPHTPPPHSSPQPKPKLLDQVRAAIRLRHYSLRTEEAYVQWIKRFIFFHGKRHPMEMGKQEITHFLSALATERHVSASTQNQALCALLFLYRHVLDQQVGWLDEVVRARRPQRLPVVLSRPEVRALLGALEGVHWLMASLLYGAGLRLLECLRLRVKDLDFTKRQLVVRTGKGDKDRVTVLPVAVAERLTAHLVRVRTLHHQDLAQGSAGCSCPMPWTASTPMLTQTGAGSGCFRPPKSVSIRAPGRNGAITCMNRCCSGP